MTHKTWQMRPSRPDAAVSLAQALDLPPLLAQLLLQRGIDTPEAANAFFSPSVEHLHDPFLMQDMGRAVDRLTIAIQEQQPILVYGDYDVDGTTSVAMMVEFLQAQGAHCQYYIPDRYAEGYGISMAGIAFAERQNIALLIAIDCGITAIDPVTHAQASGIDCIICDHHLPKEVLPPALAVLDPKRPDCPYPFKELSGCGVAFKLLQAYLQQHQLPTSALNQCLDLLAVSIACDLVPLTGENRVLAHFGLRKLHKQPRIGLRVLASVLKREPPYSISDLVFGIGPSINAAGRLADARLAVQLLLAADKQVALHLAEELYHKNNRRKDIEQQITAAAIAAVESEYDALPPILLVKGEDWHKGVVGIVAARLTEHFRRPAIVCAQADGKIVGSARSVGQFDIHAAIADSAPLLLNFGGHRFAAGVTVAPEQWDAFKTQLLAYAQAHLTAADIQPTQPIDGTLSLSEINLDFWRQLQRFAPFGPSNRSPVFQTLGVRDTGQSKLIKEQHLRLVVAQGNSRMEGMAFGLGEWYYTVKHQPVDICYVIERQSWRGQHYTRLRIKDIRPHLSPAEE